MKARLGRRPSRRAARSALALMATLVVGGAVRAAAPIGQYATFGRSDQCISDNFTKLTWIRTPLVNTVSLADATSKCATMGDGGEDSWRVPSVNELETLVDENPHYELQNGVLVPVAIDANAFYNTPVTNSYWTSSLVPGTQNAWTVYFRDGSTSQTPQSQMELSVRCVTVTPVPPAPMPTFCQ
jgi:Protein of unknown function (DUF1566)